MQHQSPATRDLKMRRPTSTMATTLLVFGNIRILEYELLSKMRMGSSISRFTSRALNGLKIGLADEIAWPRWQVATRGGRRSPDYQSHSGLSGGLEYSKKNFEAFRPLQRTRWPLFLCASIPGQARDEHGAPSRGRILIMGPRFESEIHLAEGLGWMRENISAIDLLPYSPRVTRGDMHAMPFADNLFHTIICGWTLSYSSRPDVAAREMSRVLAPGGVICFGVDVVDSTDETIPGLPKGEARVQSLEAFQILFPDYSVLAHFPPHGPRGPLIVALQKPLAL